MCEPHPAGVGEYENRECKWHRAGVCKRRRVPGCACRSVRVCTGVRAPKCVTEDKKASASPHVCCESTSPGPGASGTQRRGSGTPRPLPAPAATPAAPLWVRSAPDTNQLGDPLTERPIVNRRLSAAPTGPPPHLALCSPAPHQSSGRSATPRTPGAPVARPARGPSSLSAPHPHLKPSAETQDQSLAPCRGLVPAKRGNRGTPRQDVGVRASRVLGLQRGLL